MFKACSGSHGPIVKSPYSKNKVPVELFRSNPDDPNSKSFTKCHHCRQHNVKLAKQRKEKRLGELQEKKKQIEEGLTSNGMCTDKRHNTQSKYPRDGVPIILLVNEKGAIMNTCTDCREADRRAQDVRNSLKAKKSLNLENPSFMFCHGPCHNTNSKYARDKVPIKYFMRYPENPKSDLYERCLDCRENERRVEKNIRDKLREKARVEICTDCFKEEARKNYKSCLSCSEKSKDRSKHIRKMYYKIKVEMIVESGASCVSCGNIYFQAANNSTKIVALPTYFKNGEGRYVMYESKEYKASEFIKRCTEYLNIDVIELDHMTEYEQRSKGVLKEDDIFVPKKADVSQLGSESAMRLEARKTQNLCIMCHRLETIKRRGETKGYRSPKQLEKKSYVNKVKRSGCSNCLYVNPTCLELFDLDHIDITTKIKTLSQMIISSNTLDDVIIECSKCRVLCAFCHRIHNMKQIRSGMFKSNKECSDDEETDSF